MSSFISYMKELFVGSPKTDDPKNWPVKEKYKVVTVIAYCAFVAPLASSIYMPALVQVKDDLHTSASMVSATLSIYVLFMGIMPVFWASLCDYLGRRPIYLISMSIFIIGSLLAAISKNIWVFFVMRAIQAFGSSSVLSLGGGSLSDVFHSGERGSAFGLFYLGPLIAPMIGPIIGGVLADRAGWRSTMWLLFGTSVVALLMVFFFLPETSRKQIDSTPALETKSDAVDASNVSRSNFYSSASSTHVASEISANNSESGHNNISDAVESEKEAQGTDSHINIMIEDHHHDTALEDKMEMEVVDKQIDAMSLASIVQESTENEKDQGNNDDGVQKPVKRKHYNPLRPLLCLREPTNALLVLFNALALGSQYCMNNTLPISFSSNYGLSESLIGVCFCAAGLGSAVGSLIGGRYSDYVMRRWLIKQELKRQRDEMDRQAAFGEVSKEIKKEDVSKVINIAMRAPPEVRLQSVWVGVFALPFGLLLYGWSVQYNYPIAVPVVGIFFLGFGMMMVFSSATTALVDANSDNNMASSAVACNSFARGVSGAIGGFTALPLEGAMGSGWLYTLWAILTIFGAFGLVLMVVKAKSWRERAAAKALDKV